jgi:hypothetical protein
MKTAVIGAMRCEFVPGDYRFVRLLDPLRFCSVVLGCRCEVPAGFVFDLESAPLLRGTNPESGLIHDYLCRTDSVPVVTKQRAASVYAEFQAYYDEQESGNWFNRAWDWIRRGAKTLAVRLAPGYFHRHAVGATYEEMSA